MAEAKANIIRDELRPAYPALGSLVLFSFVTSLVTLVPPIYMMQLSERVFLSRNETTLLFLTLIAFFFIGVGAVLDAVRTRALQRVSIGLDQRISERAFDVLNRRNIAMAAASRSLVLNDLNTVRDFIASPMVIQLLDLFWTPLFVVVLFLIHPALGVTVILLLAITSGLSILNQWLVRSDAKRAQAAGARAQDFAAAVMRSAEATRVMGMLPSLRRRWHSYHEEMLGWQTFATDRAQIISAILRFARNSQMVIILLVGVHLYLAQKVSAGALFGSVLIGMRAQGPIDALVSGWRSIWSFVTSAERLNLVLSHQGNEQSWLPLPRPEGALNVSRVTLAPPNRDTAVLSDVSFSLQAGRILGVVGPSGAGKSSLAKLLVGAWRPRRGSVMIDDHDLGHWNPDELGRHVGYVPQEVELLPGTVAENIARFQDDELIAQRAVLEAAEVAGIQDIVQNLPEGYNTKLGPDGHTLSGGQRQRVALARAVYGDPKLLILDEPNSNLDSVGEQSLARTMTTMRNRGASIIIITHRMNMLTYCDDVLVMNSGTVHAFGARDHIMGRLAPSRPNPTLSLEAAEFQRG